MCACVCSGGIFIYAVSTVCRSDHKITRQKACHSPPIGNITISLWVVLRWRKLDHQCRSCVKFTSSNVITSPPQLLTRDFRVWIQRRRQTNGNDALKYKGNDLLIEINKRAWRNKELGSKDSVGIFYLRSHQGKNNMYIFLIICIYISNNIYVYDNNMYIYF